jgi:hypothetical protein
MKKWWDEITFLKVDALGASLCSSGRGRFGPIDHAILVGGVSSHQNRVFEQGGRLVLRTLRSALPAAGGRRLAALSFTSLVRLPKLVLVFLTGLVVTALASCHHRFEIGLGAAGTYRHYLFSPLFKDVGQPS